ncbi:hypothetical protein, partial [Brevibacillus agri]|uniref:hypothetical protein n=1 Tax=Brevibacillus agri TaxID=51101 RepID=UPI003D241D2E
MLAVDEKSTDAVRRRIAGNDDKKIGDLAKRNPLFAPADPVVGACFLVGGFHVFGAAAHSR